MGTVEKSKGMYTLQSWDVIAACADIPELASLGIGAVKPRQHRLQLTCTGLPWIPGNYLGD